MNKNDSLSNAINMLKHLIAFDTTSRRSNMELVEYIQSYLNEYGVSTRLTFDDTGKKANLWATIGPATTGGVVLSGHLDVVPVDGQQWSNDPFDMWESNGRLHGRGVADMKGFIAVCLAMVPQLIEKELALPIHFAFSYDEEVGCIGVRNLVDDVVDNLPLPRAVIVGEPTSMQIIGGHKGARSFQTIVKGVPAHSSNPAFGVNSIMAAARIVNFLETLQNDLEANAHINTEFNPPYSTIDLGIINGGTAKNIIPEYTRIEWGFRLHPDDDADQLQQRVFDFIDNEIVPHVKKQSEKADVSTSKVYSINALIPDDKSPAEQLIRHLTGLNSSSVVSFGTEAGIFQHAGIPAVVFGPGNIAQAHQPDEYIAIDQIDQCIGFIEKLAHWAAGESATGFFNDAK